MSDIGNPTLPLQQTIPSYAYQEYVDDLNIVAFFDSYNALSQEYLNYSNQTPLSVWSNPAISGPLLDWIGQGIYGIKRPVFSSLTSSVIAGIDAYPINTVDINGVIRTQSGTAVTASDDYYKRVLTWWLYTGDGRQFSIPWLRKRVARFLYGVNGTDITLSQTETVHILAGSVSPPFPVPSLSSVAGGAFAARKYGVRYTYVTAVGEGLPGPAASLTVAMDNLLVGASPTAANGAEGWNIYVGLLPATPNPVLAGINAAAINFAPMAINDTNVPPAFATPLTKQNATPIAIGTAWDEPSSGLVNGDPIPTIDNSNVFNNLIISVPAGTASDFFQQGFQQGLLAFPLQITATIVVE
jgi:hypothetical protein